MYSPRRIIRRARLFGTIAIVPLMLVLAHCSSPPKRGADASLAIAKIFETAEPYSRGTLTEQEIGAFFANAEYRADSAAILDFYRRRGMQYAWILDGALSSSAEAFATLAGISDANVPRATKATKRLSALYDQSFSGGQRSTLCESCGRELELRLTGEFFRFAAANYGGYLSGDARDLNWFIPRAKKDLSRLMDSLAAGKMDFAAYEPVHPQYQLLKGHIQRYAKLADVPWPALQFPGRLTRLKVGDTAAVISDIRTRLRTLGDFSGDTASRLFDSVLVSGIQQFQKRHGMTTDGIIDATLLRAINVSPAMRMRTMLVNMERLRWVPEHQPPNLLLVNIPEFHLRVYENGREVMDMEVVVGARGTRTVTFSDTLTQVVFSPSWSVPPSIVRNEILPAIAKDPNYLAKHNMEITNGSDGEPDIRQRPGGGNALGHVKFLFPNSYSIYMHDTPAKKLFEHEFRAASHGCVRLSRADELAEYLLRNDPEWTPERIREAMLSGREQTVKLKEPRPVAIVYFTAWVDREGVLQFRDDIYGHDGVLAKELFAAP